MSSNTYLEIYQSKAATFTDLNALNAELGSDFGVSELLDNDEVPSGSGFIMVGPKGKILFMNREDGEYSDTANVYACWNDSLFFVIAKHIAGGELVLKINHDNRDEVFWVLTPGHARQAKPTF